MEAKLLVREHFESYKSINFGKKLTKLLASKRAQLDTVIKSEAQKAAQKKDEEDKKKKRKEKNKIKNKKRNEKAKAKKKETKRKQQEEEESKRKEEAKKQKRNDNNTTVSPETSVATQPSNRTRNRNSSLRSGRFGTNTNPYKTPPAKNSDGWTNRTTTTSYIQPPNQLQQQQYTQQVLPPPPTTYSPLALPTVPQSLQYQQPTQNQQFQTVQFTPQQVSYASANQQNPYFNVEQLITPTTTTSYNQPRFTRWRGRGRGRSSGNRHRHK